MGDCSLRDTKVAAVLDRLHEAAKGDVWRGIRSFPPMAFRMLLGTPMSQAVRPGGLADLYLPVSREQGKFIYELVRAINATTVVEFGTSFGISTLYLAAAIKDNAGGCVIGSELEGNKHGAAESSLRDAGLSDFAEIRLGDALETFQELPEPVDLVLLDGWKDLYIPVLKLITPRLRPGALILADNIHRFKRTLRPYVEYVQSGDNGFESVTLPIDDGLEFSRYVGAAADR